LQAVQQFGAGWAVDAVPLFTGVQVGYWGSSDTFDSRNYCHVSVPGRWYVQLVRVAL
jgi:hypothetical protein